MTEQERVDLTELLQGDLLSFFDGMEQEILDKMCEIIVERVYIFQKKNAA